MLRLATVLICIAPSAMADIVVAARTVRPQTILTAADLTTADQDMAGTFADIDALIGQETRVVLYAGRPILPEDVGPAAVIDRNQIVPLVYASNGLTIRSEGRALGRASVGEAVRVMNMQSRNSVTGQVQPDGSVLVQ
ncbi:flagellar basal body P-ring formation chaperone FlgA [Pseudooceanicola sp. MF1-13]|uniref:flagellar basal body P-ring formation chaperone FlgA n=1 Tax=Pseudooceanicola sp. MF1-13 TaxID=3379095 RepID=UPI0038917184